MQPRVLFVAGVSYFAPPFSSRIQYTIVSYLKFLVHTNSFSYKAKRVVYYEKTEIPIRSWCYHRRLCRLGGYELLE